jgi:voltage-gated potassium channel
MKAHRRIIIAGGICLTIVFGGTSGYMLLEDYTFFQGLYMSAITISTVGYGEVKPLSPWGQGFSIFLIFSSIGGLALAGRALGESLLKSTWSGRGEKRRMQRRIDALSGHQIICGFGRVGRAAALQFDAARVAYVVLEQAFEPGHRETEDQPLFIEGDATHEQLLLDAGIKKAKGLLALLGSDPENVFLVLSARELNPTLHIIARANDPLVENKLLKAGADTVISPFTTAGIQVANDMLMATTGYDPAATRISQEMAAPRWVRVDPRYPFAGRTVAKASAGLGGTILGLRRGGVDQLLPGDDTILEPGDDILVAAGAAPLAENGTASASVTADHSVVIVDDNPVIVKLYTRLFQKAGFTPHTAADGATGLKLIARIKPQAAVIDFQMPVYSGIEICTRVRADAELDATRLILFTADDNTATRERALAAGADAVVVKSPEAQEVIETVIRIISS